MNLVRPVLLRLVPSIARLLAATFRNREMRGDGGLQTPVTHTRPAIYVMWHQRLVAPLLRYGREGLTVLVSPHREADFAVAILESLGSSTVRGASGERGAEALGKLIRVVDAGRPVALVPDGPLGPPRSCKPGVVELAAQTGQEVIPVAAAARRAIRLPRWDRLMVPLPFSLVVMAFGTPLRVPSGADRTPEGLAEWQERIGRALNDLTDRCDAATRRRS